MATPEPLKEKIERLIQQGQETAAQEVAVEYFEQQTELLERAGQAAMRALDAVNEMNPPNSETDPVKQRVADVLRHAVFRALDGMQTVSTGQLPAEERRAALEEAVPFSDSSKASSSTSGDGPKAIEQQQETEETDSPAPRRGRPPGSKNKPKETGE